MLLELDYFKISQARLLKAYLTFHFSEIFTPDNQNYYVSFKGKAGLHSKTGNGISTQTYFYCKKVIFFNFTENTAT